MRPLNLQCCTVTHASNAITHVYSTPRPVPKRPIVIPTSKLEQYLVAFEAETSGGGRVASALSSPSSPSSAEAPPLAATTAPRRQPGDSWGSRGRPLDERYDYVEDDGDDAYVEGGSSLEHLRRSRSLAIVAHRAQPVERDAELGARSHAKKDR